MKVAAIFAHGDTSSTDVLDYQTRFRCDKAVELYNKGAVQNIYLGSVFGASMKKYLVKSGVPTEIITSIPRGLMTGGEVKIFSQHIPVTSRIISISSWYHLPRLWIVWRGYKRKPTLVGVRGATSFIDLFMEFWKLIGTALYPKARSKTI